MWPEHRRRDGAGGCAGARISQWQPDADVDRDVWPDRHYGAACASAGCGWRHHGMEEQSVASLSAPDQGSRCADRFGVSVGDQHASGPSRACRAVRRGGRQGHGEPGVAQGADRLGCLERTRPERRTDCAADPRRHGRPRASRQESHGNLAARRHRRARGQNKGAARRQADGRGDHGRLASCPGRPHEPRPSPSSGP